MLTWLVSPSCEDRERGPRGSLDHTLPLRLLIPESQQLEAKSHQEDRRDAATSFLREEARTGGVNLF